MALICDSCGKGKLRGNRISHAHNVSKRVFNPNLHIFWVVEGGKRMKKKFCTKCLRKIKSLSQQSKSKINTVVAEPITGAISAAS